MCVGTRNTVPLQAAMAAMYNPERDQWNHTRWRKPEIVCYRTSWRYLTFTCFAHLLTDLTLADDREGEADIDILVGAGQYRNLVTG